MRSITDDELILIHEMLYKPECITMYNDLTKHHFISDYGWLVYEAIVNSDPWDKDDLLFKINNLKEKKLITQSEFANILPSCSSSNSYYASQAYLNIKEIKLKQRIDVMLENINFGILNSSEIKLKLKEIVELESEEEIKIETLQEIDKLKRDVSFANISFGLEKLDAILSIESNHFIVLGARPFNGKTTLALKFAMENTKGKKVLFISMEMNKFQLSDMAKSYGGFYYKGNLIVVERAKIKLQDIEKLIRNTKCSFVIIDQMNKIDVGTGGIYEIFTKRAEGLKLITTKLKIPVLCLAQASRDSANSKIQSHHLKGSASIEEEADIVMLLQRDSEQDNKSTLFVAKNRSGKGRLFETYLEYDEDTRFIKEIDKYY
jgi:replicative DNA helicase